MAPTGEHAFQRIGILVLGAGMIGGGALWLYQSRAVQVHRLQASRLASEGKIDEAFKLIDSKGEGKPEYDAARLMLVRMAASKHDFARAESELKRILERNPKNVYALYELGRVYTMADRVEDASTAYKRMLEVNPLSSDAHLGLGELAARSGDDKTAIDEYELAASLNPDNAGWAYYSAGLSHAKLKQYDEAIAAYRKSVESYGDTSDTETALADAFRAKGMMKEAKEAAEKAEQLKAEEDD